MARRKASSDVFLAIADPNRRKLIDLLSQRERPVKDLAPYFRMSQPGLSQHLRVLRTAGLVSRRCRGREQLYRTRAGKLMPVADWLLQIGRFWKRKLDALGTFLENEK